MTRRHTALLAFGLLMMSVVLFANGTPSHGYLVASDDVKIHYLVKGVTGRSF